MHTSVECDGIFPFCVKCDSNLYKWKYIDCFELILYFNVGDIEKSYAFFL